MHENLKYFVILTSRFCSITDPVQVQESLPKRVKVADIYIENELMKKTVIG